MTELVRKPVLLRLGILLALVVGIIYAISASQIRGPYYITVDEAAASSDRSSIRIGGWIDPDSVIETADGTSFDLLASESFVATRVAVVGPPEMLGESGWWSEECILSGRLVDGVVHADSEVISKQYGSTGYRAAPRPYDFRLLTLEPKKNQLSQLLGRDVTLRRAEEYLGLATQPASVIEIYYDDEEKPWIWNAALNIWMGTLSGSRERTVPRHQGEATLDECLVRADALANEYYLGDGGTFPELRQTWTRKESGNTFPDGRTVDIVSYDVMYERYMQGIRMPDVIGVTIYALSGGSDFVGPRLSDEITWTVRPQVTPTEADQAVRQAAAVARVAQALGIDEVDGEPVCPMLPPGAKLSEFELRVWSGSLYYRLTYDWEPESPIASLRLGGFTGCDHTEASYSVDAVSGQFIGMPIRAESMEPGDPGR